MVKKKTLVNNSISGVILLVITALLTFLCIPVFINKLGTELYGVFALVTVIGNLNIFTNIGLDAALTKFITEQGQSEDSNKDIITSLLLSSSLVILISSLVFCFRFFLLREILHIPEMYVAGREFNGFTPDCKWYIVDRTDFYIYATLSATNLSQ